MLGTNVVIPLGLIVPGEEVMSQGELLVDEMTDKLIKQGSLIESLSNLSENSPKTSRDMQLIDSFGRAAVKLLLSKTRWQWFSLNK